MIYQESVVRKQNVLSKIFCNQHPICYEIRFSLKVKVKNDALQVLLHRKQFVIGMFLLRKMALGALCLSVSLSLLPIIENRSQHPLCVNIMIFQILFSIRTTLILS